VDQRLMNIDGHSISVRLMDESYIMCEDERKAGLTVDISCRQLSGCWPNPLYSAYYRKLLAAYVVGPVFVWEDRRIIGFLPIMVPHCGLPQLPHCIHYVGGMSFGAEAHMDLPMVEKAAALPFEQLDHKEIRIGCMSVHPRMRGKNLAASMVQYLADWGREKGWDQLKARAMLDNEPEAFYPTLSFWLRLGFKQVGPVRPFGPSSDPIEQSKSVDLVLDLRI
jgi:GNAT superfamily N-acetyltransferase